MERLKLQLAEELVLKHELPLAPPQSQPTVSPSHQTAAGGWDRVLIVNDQDLDRRLLRAVLKTEPYEILETKRAADALEMVQQQPVSLVILDLMMPDMSGLEFCRRIKANRKTRLIPVLIITSITGVENEIAGITSGADEFLIRPVHPSVLRTRIRAMLRNKAAVDRLEEAETILFALAQAIEQRDRYTSGHCERLAFYSVSLGSALGLPEEQLIALYRGGYLHDIGKVSVPDVILFRPGKLSEQEWEVMRAHTIKGEDICRPLKSLAPVLPIIRSHHERWDGSGYPDGLQGEEIPLLARIMQVADIYDALTTARPYKPAFSSQQALRILQEETEKGWRDPELVSLFASMQDSLAHAHQQTFLKYTDFESMQQSLSNLRAHLMR